MGRPRKVHVPPPDLGTPALDAIKERSHQLTGTCMFCKRKTNRLHIAFGVLLPSCRAHFYPVALIAAEMFYEAMTAEASRETIAELDKVVPKWRDKLAAQVRDKPSVLLRRAALLMPEEPLTYGPR